MTAAATLAAAGGPREIFRRILRNAGLILGGKAATALLNLAATSIAIRSLGLEAMGVLVLVHAFARTASSFVKFQSWQAVLRYGAGCLEPERRAEFHALLRFTAGLDLARIGRGLPGVRRRGLGARPRSPSAGRRRWRPWPRCTRPRPSSW